MGFRYLAEACTISALAELTFLAEGRFTPALGKLCNSRRRFTHEAKVGNCIGLFHLISLAICQCAVVWPSLLQFDHLRNAVGRCPFRRATYTELRISSTSQLLSHEGVRFFGCRLLRSLRSTSSLARSIPEVRLVEKPRGCADEHRVHTPWFRPIKKYESYLCMSLCAGLLALHCGNLPS